MTGPMTREAFIWAELSEMAPGRSCFPTSPGRTAEYAGPNIALPAPTPSTITTSRTCEGWGEDATRATPSENTICSIDRMMRKRLRSILSARRPPTMGRTRVGPSWAKMMTPTNVAECVRSYAYAPRTTFCIQVPMLEAKAPKKTMRKVGCASAARAVPDRAGRGVSPSTTASSISSMEIEPSSPPGADPEPEFPLGRGASDEGGTRPSYGRFSRSSEATHRGADLDRVYSFGACSTFWVSRRRPAARSVTLVHSGEGRDVMTRPVGPTKVSSSLALPDTAHLFLCTMPW